VNFFHTFEVIGLNESPLVMIIISLVLLLVLLLASEHLLRKTSRVAVEQLQQIEKQLSEYRDYTVYLKSKDRLGLMQRLDSILESIRFLRIFRLLISQQQKEIIQTSLLKTNELISFISKFTPEYTKREVERHQDFFAGKVFDKDQLAVTVGRSAVQVEAARSALPQTPDYLFS